MSKITLTLVWLAVAIAVSAAAPAEDCKCPKFSTPYLELGCKPVKEGTDCCPKRFDCSNLEERSKDKCHVGGKTFDIGTRIPKDLVTSDCSSSCKCIQGKGKSAVVQCSNIECPELLGPRPDPKCILQYKLDSCCSTDQVCEPQKVFKLAACHLEGKSYKEGQRMYPKADTCQKCVCAPGFNGKLEKPFCKPFSCGIEVNSGDSVQKSCAPLFYGDERCCPVSWRCHESTDVITTNKDKHDKDPMMTCKFGDLVLKLGDVVTPKEEKCVKCTCMLPPLMTCVKDPKCN